MKKNLLASVGMLLVLCVPVCLHAQDSLIRVTSPAYCAEIKGKTRIEIVAPGFEKVTVKCWKQGPGFGSDATVGEVKLDAQGRGAVVFPADRYPKGPLTVRISGAMGEYTDNCYLQLYNKGGVSWMEGLPAAPPATKGMKLIFADDFDGELSLGDGPDKRYYDHKPPYGKQDFSTIRFTSFDKPNNPFAQMGSYLRIRASEKLRSAGLISSLRNDTTGIMAQMPCYFECRFIGPNAIGSWPAFWLLSVSKPGDVGGDELDIIEAYGGEGKGKPNAKDGYMVTPHAWNQPGAPQELADRAYKTLNPVRMNRMGIPSTWYEALHTYGCKITESVTIYYCDDIEVARHETLPVSKIRPFYFLINLATGGGWPVDISRYGQIDMYVDYVRVYGGASN